jgi:hypothetical protein
MERTGIDPIYKGYFRRGMKLAQLPHTGEYRDDNLNLSPEEVTAIARDKIATTGDEEPWRLSLKKWNLPGQLWFLVTVCAIGAAGKPLTFVHSMSAPPVKDCKSPLSMPGLELSIARTLTAMLYQYRAGMSRQ